MGECSGIFPRFAYDQLANECRSFTYGGCGGNGNNFGSMAECRKKCVRGQVTSVEIHVAFDDLIEIGSNFNSFAT